MQTLPDSRVAFREVGFGRQVGWDEVVMDCQWIPWQRRVLRLGELPATDHHGWPLASAGRSLRDQRALPVLVLLGERGMGKSVAMQQECASLKERGDQAVLLDLGQCTEASLAKAELEEAFRPPDEPGDWYVLLDGLDEGLDDLSSLDLHIARAVERLEAPDRERLRLRISCRTARWPERMWDTLRRLWPEQALEMTSLVPLSRNDVARAALGTGIADADVFTALVQQRALVALATHPVTLRQLLIGYVDSGRLPDTAQKAYHDACLHLCGETRRPTNPQLLQGQASPEHLLAVAARAAAALQVGRHTALSDVQEPPRMLPSDLQLSQLHGGTEPGHLGSVSCTLDELRRLTASSLLVPMGTLRWVFAHQSYREFLAARFLEARNMSPEVQRELLWIGDGPTRHVLPMHQEVAAWRAGSDPTVFEDLLRDDPLVLLLADLPGHPEENRARTVDALFVLLKRDDAVTLDSASLHRLNHPRLAGQLRPHLKNRAEWNVLNAAASIARACRLPELAGDLLDVAEDRGVYEGVRVLALSGVTSSDDEAVERIRALSQDSSAEVAATALRQLRPDHISLVDFLDRVRDPDPRLFGTARRLRGEIPELLDTTEITEAVSWADRTLRDPASGASPVLAVAILARAVTLADQTDEPDALLACVASAMQALAGNHDLLFNGRLNTQVEGLERALADEPNVRRRLALHLLERCSEDELLSLLTELHGGILPQADSLYWMENWDRLSAVDIALSRQAVRFSPPEEPETQARAQDARAAHPTLRDVTDFWDNPPAEAPWQREQREERERALAEARRNAYNEADLRAALNDVLAARSDQVRRAWTQVIHHLHRTADGTPPPHTTQPLLTLLDQAPSRPSPGTDLEPQLVRAARHVLQTAPPLGADAITPSGALHYRAVPELTAFDLIDDPITLPSDQLRSAGWAVALASAQTFRPRAADIQRRFLPVCTQHAGHALPTLLTDVLDRADDETTRAMACAFAAIPGCAALPVLHAWAEHPGRTAEQWHTVLGELAVAGDVGALNRLARALATDPSGHQAQSPERTRWMLAARMLLRCESLPTHWPDIRRRLNDPAILTEFRDSLDRLPILSGEWTTGVSQLPEKDLADLYTLLVDHIGTNALEIQPGRERDDTLVAMGRALPNLLAGRTTPQAAAELRNLARRYPSQAQLRVQARSTARAAASIHSTPISPEDLIRLADSSDLRWIDDEHHLLDIVEESLTRFRRALHGPNGLIVALWNRRQPGVNHTEWWPCWEEDLSDITAAFLLQDIGGNRVVINREVQIRRPGFPGLRTDIQIEAPAREGIGEDPIKVVIECKGCWNETLKTALREQLVDQYLQTPRTAGLFLTGYFHCDRWDEKRQRNCPKTGHSLDEVAVHQREQARITREGGAVVSSVTLDCALPSKGSDWRMETVD
ncbi:hypothetical protein [Kitasatospora cinereorecta]|uniref:ATP-binding protein n=1 Tax=Kitasatospora cinereorecta TaxID=285560 RepID=A0ABW0VK24_9ACTN